MGTRRTSHLLLFNIFSWEKRLEHLESLSIRLFLALLLFYTRYKVSFSPPPSSPPVELVVLIVYPESDISSNEEYI